MSFFRYQYLSYDIMFGNVKMKQKLYEEKMVQFCNTMDTLFIQMFLSKIVSMIRKYHNHKLQTNPWHPEEEPHDNHETPGRQTKLSIKLSLPHQDNSKTRRDIK